MFIRRHVVHIPELQSWDQVLLLRYRQSVVFLKKELELPGATYPTQTQLLLAILLFLSDSTLPKVFRINPYIWVHPNFSAWDWTLLLSARFHNLACFTMFPPQLTQWWLLNRLHVRLKYQPKSSWHEQKKRMPWAKRQQLTFPIHQNYQELTLDSKTFFHFIQRNELRFPWSDPGWLFL